MRLTIASGKGGTGKTLLATNLCAWLSRRNVPIAYVDADVEEPNGHLFLPYSPEGERRTVVKLPALAGDRCEGHGRCQQACAFHAILSLGDRVLVFPELCHSCGHCLRVCPSGALVEVDREIGSLRWGRFEALDFFDGILDVGEVRAVPLIEALIAHAEERHAGTLVVDAPPGTSCAAMAAVRGADRVLLVTEPTPFGLHDLRLAVEMSRALGRSVAAVLNRCDLGDRSVQRYLEEAGVPLVAEIPYDPSIAAAYARGRLALESSSRLRDALEAVAIEWMGLEP